MKSKPVIHCLFLSLILFIPFSCDKNENETVPETITVESSTSDVTETSFIINWTINSSDINNISIELSLNEAFNPIEREITVTNLSQTSHLVEQVQGATEYYYRVIVGLKDGTTKSSDQKVVVTAYRTESVTITTSDGINIAGKLKYLENGKGIKPGIIFMHELGIWVNNWQSADVVTNLIAQGYACLIIDFRGHGQSDAVPLPSASEIEAFIQDVSNDLIASIEFMKNHEFVNGEKLALVGGSLGAIMALAGNGYDEVKASVSLSGTRLGINSIFQGLQIKSAFFIAGENDISSQGTNFPEEATILYNNAEEPKKLKIVLGSAEHGTKLLSPLLNQEIIDWINERINE